MPSVVRNVVTQGRFLGPNLLVQAVISASNFAQAPTIGATEIPAILQEEVAQSLARNNDIQELGLLARVMEEKALRDHAITKQVGGDVAVAAMAHQGALGTWLYAIGNAKADKNDPLAEIPRAMEIQEWLVSSEGLKRVLVMRDIVGFGEIEQTVSKQQFNDEAHARRFIRNVVLEAITERVSEIAGIDDTRPLHDLIENLLQQSREAYKITNGWRRDMVGPYADMMTAKNRNFEAAQRNIKASAAYLAKQPMRNIFSFAAPRHAENAIA